MRLVALLLIISCILTACHKEGEIPEGEELGYDYYAINMKSEFEINDTLESVEKTPAKVIILIGQSNATGCSLTSYLREGVSEEKYAEFDSGYDNVLINFAWITENIRRTEHLFPWISDVLQAWDILVRCLVWQSSFLMLFLMKISSY